MGRIDPERKERLVNDVKERYDRISGTMNELSKRLWAGNECLSIGHGCIGIVSMATGMARNTVVNGRNEVIAGKKLNGRIRARGAGRRRSVEINPGLPVRLQEIIAPFTRGDPMSSLLWKTKVPRTLKNHPCLARINRRKLRFFSLISLRLSFAGESPRIFTCSFERNGFLSYQ